MALACHVNPDADALGSMLGLAAFLRSRGVRTVCSYPNEPLDPPRWAALLPGSEDLVPVRDYPKQPAVMVTCDCAAFDRLGALGHPAEHAGELIWIDHHRSNDGRGTIPLVDPDASSTCEMVFRLIETMGGAMPDETALCLYAGLVTDTGRFQYEATTPETLRVAAKLREHPFEHAKLVQALYEDNLESYLKLVGTALGRLEHVEDADLVWTYLTQSDLREAGIHPSETDDLIDVVRTARDVDVAAIVKQQKRRTLQGERALARRSRPLARWRRPSVGVGTGWRPATPRRTVRPRRSTGCRGRCAANPSPRDLPGTRDPRRVPADRQAAGDHVPRRGGDGATRAGNEEGRARGHPRSDGDRPAGHGRRPGYPAPAVPRRSGQDLRGHVPPGGRDHHPGRRR